VNAPVQHRLADVLHDAATHCKGRGVVAVERLDLHRLRPPSDRPAELAIEFDIDIDDRPCRLRVALDRAFPRRIPDIFLIDHATSGFLAHVQAHSGWVCYLSSEGASISRRDPFGVIVHAIETAVSVLSDAFAGASRSEIADELPAYWHQHRDQPAARCFVAPRDAVKTIEYTVDDACVRYVADSMQQVQRFFPTAKTAPVRNGIYVPLLPSVRIENLDPRLFAAHDHVRAVLERHVESAQRRGLARVLRRRRSPRLIVLGIPRSDGSRALVGVHHATPSPGGRENRLLVLERWDADYLRERGGAAPALRAAHVVLFGCGAVGGHLATALASAGVGHLSLVDPEDVSVDNAFRHVLGRAAYGSNKAAALAAEIKRRLPDTEVDAYALDADCAIDQGVLDRVRVDLVCVAIGEPSESRALNEVLFDRRVPALHSWLEPLGVGGHALATIARTAGCYECLFVDDDGQERLAARADFVAPGQSFSRDIAGCAAAFTPYSDLDARRTAEVAARLGVDLLSGVETRSSLVSWKGDAGAFRAAGFSTSPRWELSFEELEATRHAFAAASCSVCAQRRE
jgi:hypothetical protein